MTAEEAVYTRLLETSGVTDLVSTRVYQLTLPQEPTLPAIRVALIVSQEDPHLRGPNRTERTRVQVDIFTKAASGADPYASAEAIDDAVRMALTGAPFEVTGRRVSGVLPDVRRATYDAAELREVQMSRDFIVWSKRAA